MTIKVGDTVKFRDDLTVGKSYSHPDSSCNIDFIIGMKRYIGKTAKVRNISKSGNVIIEGSDYFFSPAMFISDPIDLLQPGYVAKLRRDGLYFIVMPTEEGLAFVNKDNCSFLISKEFTSDLKRKDEWTLGDIVAIYGLNRNAKYAFEFGKDYRKLIWQREEIVELTMEEVAKLAGYSIDQIKIRKE